MRVLPCGDRALLVELDTLAAVRAAHTRWSREAPAGMIELVPAARTVLVRLDTAVLGLGAAETWLRAHPPLRDAAAEPGAIRAEHGAEDRPTEIAVVYDGDDLPIVAASWRCSPDEVAARHAAIDWVCAFIGFAPGFPYLVPTTGAAGDTAAALPPVPRRATSRPRVPAGAVALAAEYCGIYPRESPGGWQLIGRTAAPLWDVDRPRPALIEPGARVRFRAVAALDEAPSPGPGRG